MIRASLTLLLATGLAACASNHDIANGQDTSSVTAATLDEHCESACQLLVDCGNVGTSEDCACSGDVCECTTSESMTLADCTSNCVEYFGDSLSRGVASCEAAATEFFSCLETAPCSALSGGDAPGECNEALGRVEGSCDIQDNAVSSGGTAPIAGGGGVSPTVDRYLTCRSGAAFAGEPAGPPAPGIVCEGFWQECSDGHNYQVTCADPDGSGARMCSCLVDDRVVGTFDGPTVCMETGLDVVAINAGCGWNLLP